MNKKSFERKLARIVEIEEMLDQHDCHFGPEDGCICENWLIELSKLRKQLSTDVNQEVDTIDVGDSDHIDLQPIPSK